MNDHEIVELYWMRDEKALEETRAKYGRYCYAIAYNILHNHEDSDESVNDTYLGAWNSIPPHRPELLSTFLGKITRNLSLKKLRSRLTQKRGGGEAALALEELEACLTSPSSMEETILEEELAQTLDKFLRTLPEIERRIFLCRYWYFDSISDISLRYGFGKSKVKMMLLRTREKLRKYLEQEDIYL